MWCNNKTLWWICGWFLEVLKLCQLKASLVPEHLNRKGERDGQGKSEMSPHKTHKQLYLLGFNIKKEMPRIFPNLTFPEPHCFCIDNVTELQLLANHYQSGALTFLIWIKQNTCCYGGRLRKLQVCMKYKSYNVSCL